MGTWELTTHFAHQDDESDDIPHLQQAGGITISQDGCQIAISDIHAGYVNICDDTGRIQLKLPIDNTALRVPEFNRYSPHDIVIGYDRYFITDYSCFVKVYNEKGSLMDKFQVASQENKLCTKDVRLSGIVIDKNGLVLVGAALLSTSTYEGFISKHTQTGTHISTITLTDGILPQFLAVTSLNTIIVSSWSPPWMPNTSTKIATKTTVQILHESGQLLQSLTPPQSVSFWRPTGVCCSGDLIFVANDNQVTPYEYGVYCFSLSGEYLGCVTKKVINPTGVVVTEDGNKLLVSQNELGNHMAGCGLHGIKVFHRKQEIVGQKDDLTLLR